MRSAPSGAATNFAGDAFACPRVQWTLPATSAATSAAPIATASRIRFRDMTALPLDDPEPRVSSGRDVPLVPAFYHPDSRKSTNADALYHPGRNCAIVTPILEGRAHRG